MDCCHWTRYTHIDVHIIRHYFPVVISQPESYTVLRNVGSIFSVCKGNYTESSQIEFYQPISQHILSSNTATFAEVNEYGIYLSVDKEVHTISWTVNMTNIRNTSVIRFRCLFLTLDLHTFFPSNDAVITVIDGMFSSCNCYFRHFLFPFTETLAAPEVIEYNKTYIELVWYPLEHFNEVNYTVSITNTTSGTTTNIATQEYTSLVLTQREPSTTSNPLIITVQALTDVGSVTSSSLTTGFPKGIDFTVCLQAVISLQ